MTKAEHQQRAAQLAWQIKHCYSKAAKKKISKELQDHLRQSLRVPV